MAKITKFSASDEFIAWAQSLSGLITKMRTEFGSIPEMIECSEWDEGRTHYALALVQSLSKQLSQVKEEFEVHVKEKYGQDDG